MSQYDGGQRNDSSDGGNRRSSNDRRGGGFKGNRGFGSRSGGGNRRFNSRSSEGNRRDDRSGYGRRNDRRDDRRDDRRQGGRWENRRDDRSGYGRRNDRNDRDGYGKRNDRDDRRGDRRDDRWDGRRNERNDRRDNRHQGGRPGGGNKFKHSNRRGVGRAQHSGPQRSGYREERLNKRLNEPEVPADIDPKELDPSVRQELRSLAKDNADMVAKHLIQAAVLLDEDPQKALEHARAAKDRAGRVAVARETNGIVAYHAGEWKEAISELRAARRMSGGPGLLAVLADCERGLGRPEKALEVAREEDLSELDPESRTELAIVLAGAHHDLADKDAALLTLQEQLDAPDVPQVSRMRLFYAYADALELLGRKDEAIEWFSRAAELDTEEVMDTSERLSALTSENSENTDGE